MKKNIRFFLGIISFVILFLISNEKSNVSSDFYFYKVWEEALIGCLVVVTFTSSILNKFLMIINEKNNKISLSSIVFFICFLLLIIFLGNFSSENYSSYKTFIIYLFLLGWPFIDIIDRYLFYNRFLSFKD